MDRKRLYRSWWLWAIVIIFAIFVLPSVLSGGGDYHSVDTSDALAQVKAGNVTKAVMHDKEQSLTLDLKNAARRPQEDQHVLPGRCHARRSSTT